MSYAGIPRVQAIRSTVESTGLQKVHVIYTRNCVYVCVCVCVVHTGVLLLKGKVGQG